MHQQAYCAKGRGGSRCRRPGATAGRYAEAQPRADRTTALFAYIGAFTTPERKGHAGGINVYRVDPTSGELLEIANPSFLTLDRAQRFLYSVHADLEEVSAYAIDKQSGRITALNRQFSKSKSRPYPRAVFPADA